MSATINAAHQLRLVGPFQQLVMIALIRLGPDTSAADIRRHIERRTGRRVSITAVHTTLQRLAARGYTRSWSRPIRRYRGFDPDEWRTCSLSMLRRACRRFHTLQWPGRRALRLTLRLEDMLRDGIPGLGREHELYSRWTSLSSPPPPSPWTMPPPRLALRPPPWWQPPTVPPLPRWPMAIDWPRLREPPPPGQPIPRHRSPRAASN